MSDVWNNRRHAFLDFKKRNMRVIEDYISSLEMQSRINKMKPKGMLI